MDNKKLNSLIEHLPIHPGIHGKERLFNSAVMVSLIKIKGEYNFLFEKRAMGISQEGEVCFPGGGFEDKKDLTCMDAAMRETSEELGIPQDKIQVIGRMNTIVAAMGATIDPFIGILKDLNPEEISFQKDEVEKIFYVPVSWFVNNEPETYHILLELSPFEIDEKGNKNILLPVEELGLPPRYSAPWGKRKQRVFVYKVQGEVIWGLTAEMIREFVKFYKKSI